MRKDRMTTADIKLAELKKVYDYARKNADSDRLTTKDIENARQAIMKKGGGMARRGMGAALRGGGMAQRGMGAALKKGGMSKARAGKMMNLKMVKKKKKK